MMQVGTKKQGCLPSIPSMWCFVGKLEGKLKARVRFREKLEAKFYDDTRFFRVLEWDYTI
jgi:hypothetical protein